MRYHILRFDIWFCLIISVGLAFATEKIATNIFEVKYEKYKEGHIEKYEETIFYENGELDDFLNE